MKGFTITSSTLLMIFALVVGVLILVGFTNSYSRMMATKCWKDTLNELDTLKSNIDDGKETPSELTLRSSCLDRIVFGGQNSYRTCTDACDDMDEDKKCMQNCGKCKGKEGCIITVPKIPSRWNYLKVWNAWETLQKRSQTVETYSTINKISGIPLESPEEGTKTICITPTKSGEIYEMIKKEGSC